MIVSPPPLENTGEKLEKVREYNQDLSSFMRRHNDAVSEIDLEFHHEEMSMGLLQSLLALGVKVMHTTVAGVRHYEVSYMDIAPIRIIDRTDGEFLTNPDLDCKIIYTGPPAEINIFPNYESHRATALSRPYPIIGNQEHMEENIYSSDVPITEGDLALLETIMNDPNLEALRHFPVSIVGAGEVGSWGMILMTMLGMEDLSFYEQEEARLTAKHMGKMPYLASDEGMRKSQLMLQRLYRMNPNTSASYEGEMDKLNLDSLEGSQLIISAMDNFEVMADLHEYAYDNGIDLLLTTDVGKGALAQIFKYSTGEVELLHGLVTPDELRRAQYIKEGKIEAAEDEKSPVIKLLGQHRVITQFDFETVKSFLYGSGLGHFGYLPQDPSAALVAASLTNTIIWKLATGQEIEGNTFFIDPDAETNRKGFSRMLAYVNNALQAQIFSRIGMLKGVSDRVKALESVSIES